VLWGPVRELQGVAHFSSAAGPLDSEKRGLKRPGAGRFVIFFILSEIKSWFLLLRVNACRLGTFQRYTLFSVYSTFLSSVVSWFNKFVQFGKLWLI